MTPEVADYLAKVSDELTKARRLLDILDYADEGGRAAYPAGFHAAQAMVFAQTGKAAKSHAGLRSVFARLAKDAPRIDRALTRFLAQAYKLKETADYGIGADASVTVAEAQETIDAAARFVDRMAEMLA